MSRFAAILNTLNDKLVLPQPARSRVLLEIAGDLQAFFDIAREEGHSATEAERLAVEAFHPSSEAVTALVRVHGSPVALLLDGLSSQAQTVWERLLLAIALVPAAAVSLSAISDLQVFRVAGWPAWLLVGVAAGAFAVAVQKLFQLFVMLDHRPRVLRRGMQLLFGLSIAPAPLGLLWFVVELYRALGAFSMAWPDGSAELALALHRGSAVMTLALTATVVGLVMWFLLTRRIARIEQHEAEMLLNMHRKGESDV